MVRCTLLLSCVVGCATANREPQGVHDADAQTPADATKRIDASFAADAATTADAATGMCSFTGVLATYSFSGETGNQAQTPAASSATGVVATPIVRAPSLTAALASSSMSSSNWSLAAQPDATKYYAFSIAPSTGCMLSLTAAAIDAHASPNGPTLAAVATSSDNFAAKVAVSTSGASTPALTVMNASGAVEIRIYGYAATTTGGTFRLRTTLTVSGALK